MKKHVRLTAILMSLMVAAGTAACGQSANTGTSSGSSTDEQTSSAQSVSGDFAAESPEIEIELHPIC